MKNMTLERAASVCGGRLCGEYMKESELGRVVIDSRAVTEGDFFVAYRGEKADGHDYISAAFDRGAGCCLVERVPEGETRPMLLVPDVQEALERICADYRSTLTLPVIGITGSVGKTSAKEMIAAVLSQRFKVLKTEKNLNNQIGVPMTISRIEPSDEAAVIELGISDFGEMSRLSAMARPDIAVFTVIGHAHLEFLHDLDGVLRAKTEMLDHMPDDALVIMNGDDEKLRGFDCNRRRIFFGMAEDCDIHAENIRISDNGFTDCDILCGKRHIAAHIPAYGQHMVSAALEGAAVGIAMGLIDEEIERGIASYETVGRRGAVTKTDYITLIDDCYNANPDSMKCGIDSLMKISGRHVCIFGDMLELGENSAQMHRSVGAYAREKGIDLVLGSGKLAAEICLGAGDRGVHFDNNAELVATLKQYICPGDAVLVKASRGMHLEEVAEALKELGR